MGFGDEIMGSGFARGAAEHGKLVAFGAGYRIDWSQWCESIYRGNPNVAHPGQERLPNLKWINYRRGNRIYNQMGRGRWIWNYQFKAIPGELFLTDKDEPSDALPSDFVLIEPNVPTFKSVAPNKQWPIDRYQHVVDGLYAAGRSVLQLDYGGRFHLQNVQRVPTYNSIRTAFAILRRASLYVGGEGGMHHAAAALGVKAVVIFGGFIPPQVTGYDCHVNLTGNSQEACGSLVACLHCRQAMASITVDEVLSNAEAQLR